MVESTKVYFERKLKDFFAETQHLNVPKVLCISATKNLSTPDFYIPSFRIYEFAACFTIMIRDTSHLDLIEKLCNGYFSHVIIDVEAKFALLNDFISKTRILFHEIPLHLFHGNNVTSEAIFSLTQNLVSLYPSNLLIYGAGNLGSRVSQLLIECGHNVFIFRRDARKGREIAHSINTLKSDFCTGKCFFVEDIASPTILFDGIIGTSSTPFVIPSEILDNCKVDAFFIDAGLMNFSKDAISKITKSKKTLYSTNVNITFKNFLKATLESYEMNQIPSKSYIEGLCLVKAGIVAPFGSFVVDDTINTKKIFGIANGSGGLLQEQQLTLELRSMKEKLKIVKKIL